MPETPAPCLHPETELRYRHTNRALQRQCLTCGAATSKALPYSQFTEEQKALAPDWDNKLADTFWEKRRQENVAAAEQRNEEFRRRCELTNPHEIPALPSWYANVKFRSRLEARWAAYLDLIGFRWSYEPEGFALPQGNYCPDFYCDNGDGFFVEVKPTEAALAAVKDKLLSLAMLTKHEVYGVVGPPTIQPQWAAFPDGGTSAETRAHVIICAYAFGKWGRVYYNDETDGLCDDETEWQLAAGLRFENGVAERLK